MNDIVTKKHLLRKSIKASIANLSEHKRNKESEAVRLAIEQTIEFNKAKTIMCYWSMPTELNTLAMIQNWSSKKTIVLPCVNGNDLEARLFQPQMLHAGYYSIPEPTKECELIKPNEIDLIIVPGMAFDKYGNRLGHGKGFYDHFLEQTNATLIGVAFDCQLVSCVPVEKHDKRMHYVITASKTINCDKTE